jgi:decaprenylphosphoryl-5-phosphoribose phosphatase
MGLDRMLEHAGRRHPPGNVARMVARLAQPSASIVEGLVAAVALRNEPRAAWATALAAPLANACGEGLKDLARRPRPLAARFTRNGRQSFPSTHLAGVSALIACLWGVAPPTKLWRCIAGAATAAVTAVAVERICAGAHWPSDVVAGALLGTAVGAGLCRTSRRLGPAV